MSMMFIDKDGKNLSGSNTKVYGQTGFETLRVEGTGLSVDQNIERVAFQGKAADYLYQQTGNVLRVLQSAGDAVTTVASITIRGGETGTQLIFTDGSANARMSLADGVMNMALGGQTVATTAGTLTPILNPGLNYASAQIGGSPSMSRLFLGGGDSQTLAADTQVYGGTGHETARLEAAARNVQIDQNIERVELAGSASDYQFQQSGNILQVLAGTTQIARIVVAETDTTLAFSNGAARAHLAADGTMTLGGARLTASASAQTPELDPAGASHIATPTRSGTVADGYIRGATIFEDLNGDGLWNEGEAKATTDSTGNFTLPGALGVGTLVASGGTDIATNLPFSGSFSAPAGSTAIGPLSTLIQAMTGPGTSADQAEARVKAALGLSADLNLNTFDPIHALSTAGSDAAALASAARIMAAAVQVNNLLAQGSAALLGAAEAATPAEALGRIAQALGRQIAGNDGPLSLSDASTLQHILQDAASNGGSGGGGGSGSGSGRVEALSADIATLLASHNAAVATAAAPSTGTNPSGSSLLTGITKVAIIAQGDVATAIRQVAGTSDGHLEQTIQQYTGSALDSKISQTQVGDVAGTGNSGNTGSGGGWSPPTSPHL